MQIKKAEVKEKIYNAAFEEFYEKNFKKATMSTISEKSGVPVGNIYRYYVNKEAILQDIVGNVAVDMMEIFSNKHFDENEIGKKHVSEIFRKSSQDFLEKVINLFSKNRKELEILMEKSHGSKYENFKNTIHENFVNNAVSGVKIIFNNKELDTEDLELVKIAARIFLKGLSFIMTNHSTKDDFKRNMALRYSDFFMTDIVSRLNINN